MDYTPFVAGAYAIAAGTLAVLIGWVWLERRSARKALVRAERTLSRAEQGS